MTATYDNHGLQLMYPGNWKLTDQSGASPPWHITIETPEGGLWSLTVFSQDADPETLLADALDAIKQTYDEVEMTKADPDFAPFESVGVNADFYCLDFVVSAQIRVISTNDSQLVLLYQAETREFEQKLDVFRAVTQSVLQNSDVA